MIQTQTIEEAWFLACQGCLKHGFVYKIERGSFVGHERKQLPFLSGVIFESRPLVTFHKGRCLATETQIEDYFVNYLMFSEKKPNEVYTYSERIVPYLPYVIDMLRETPWTNQTTIEIARPEDVLLEDPPCLRLVSWKMTPHGLQLTTFWRSWDLYSAFPTNMGGMQLLNEFVAQESELELGPMVFYSDGAHLYDDCWKFFE